MLTTTQIHDIRKQYFEEGRIYRKYPRKLAMIGKRLGGISKKTIGIRQSQKFYLWLNFQSWIRLKQTSTNGLQRIKSQTKAKTHGQASI